MKFNFSNLEPIEFENLCKDLISEIEKKEFKIYAQGRDGGIDFKWEEDKEKIIGQAKHYMSSSRSSLLSAVKKERVKMLFLKPTRYIFMTSFSINPSLETEIFENLQPHMKSKNDIYGLENINELLDDHKKVLHKNYKLWFTGAEILEDLLLKAEQQDIKIEVDKILEKKELYVHTKVYDRAVEILDKKKFLLITGEPGVGKTSLAEMLILRFLDLDYKLKFVTSQDIKDIKKILSSNPDKKEVIFIDDFLGSNYLKYFQGENEGEELVKFFENHRYFRNKYIILTSRITILNKAYQRSEKLSRIKKEHYHIEIVNYNRDVKSKIFYNHLKFFKLDKKYIKEILEDKNYKKVIEHKNYYPRLIEFICKPSNYSLEKYSSYFNFMIESLDNPNEIWAMAFNNNLKDNDKYLLRVLFTFDGKANKEKLEKAFYKRLEEENIRCDSDLYELSLKHLEGGFIKILSENKITKISFLNPSVMDFMLDRYQNKKIEIIKALKGALYGEQVKFLLHKTLTNEKNKELIEILIEKINDFKFNTIEEKLRLLESIFCEEHQEKLEKEMLKIIFYIINKKIELDKTNIYKFINLIYSIHDDLKIIFNPSKYYDKTNFSQEFKKELLDFLLKEPKIIGKLIVQLKSQNDIDRFYQFIFEEIKVFNFIDHLDEFENKVEVLCDEVISYYDIEEKAYNLINDGYDFNKEFDFEEMEEELKKEVFEEFYDIENSFESFLSYIDTSDWEYRENYLYKIEDDINESLKIGIEASISKIWIDWEEIKDQVEEEIKIDMELDLDEFEKDERADEWGEIDKMFEKLGN